MITFDLNEQPIDYVIDEADTIPFFTERKCIIAKNASFLKAAEKGKEKIDHDLKRLESWLENPTDTAVTVFIAPYEKLDERKKVGADAAWESMISKYNIIAKDKVNANLSDYVTEQTLNGVYTMVGDKEADIRHNKSARNTVLLKEVFAIQDSKLAKPTSKVISIIK